jgi:hypothetical protein
VTQFHADRSLGESLAKGPSGIRPRIARLRTAGIGQFTGGVSVDRDGLCRVRDGARNHTCNRQNDDPLFHQNPRHSAPAMYLIIRHAACIQSHISISTGAYEPSFLLNRKALAQGERPPVIA